MSDPNCSVIICDSPATGTTAKWSNAVTNYRKRLRSSDSSRNLLDTPYESPLNHFTRNLKPISEDAEGGEDVSDVTVIATPPAKKRKTRVENARQLFNPDESIVVVADTRPAAAATDPNLDPFVLDVGENDVVRNTLARKVPNVCAKKKSPVKAKAKGKTPVKVGKKLKQKRLKASAESSAILPKSTKRRKAAKSTPKKLAVNDENHNGQIMASRTNEDAVATASDVEEIEVIWSSGPNAETASTEVSSVRENPSREELFVVDVAPSLPNERFGNTKINSRSKKKDSHSNRHDRNSKKSDHDKNSNKSRGEPATGRLREIVIDGSNVAMGHSRNKTFSEKGLKIVIDYFKSRGHPVKVFLPQSSRARGRSLIEKLHVEGTVVFTPSRTIAGKKITPYDDRFILEYATQCDGIVVTSDQYRDLWAEKPQWRNTIENRLLTPTFVGDYLMFPEDPLGRAGPKLEQFLRH